MHDPDLSDQYQAYRKAYAELVAMLASIPFPDCVCQCAQFALLGVDQCRHTCPQKFACAPE